MLNVGRESLLDAAQVGGLDTPRERHLAPLSALRNLRKYHWTSIIVILAFMGTGLAYAMTSTRLYTAESEIMIDARRSHAAESGGANRSLAELGMDPASIESQVSVLGSESIAIQALKQLHLEDDVSLATPTTLPGLWIRALKRALGREPVEERQGGVSSEVLDGFMRSLDVKRIQQTYVLSLRFTDPSAERAAVIVNTLADVYASGQVKSALAARKQAADWLRDRLASTRSEIGAAEQAVRSLKTEMGIASSGSAGVLVRPDPERLRRLEQNLEDKRMLYSALVDRSNAALQQQLMPVSDATVLKPARAPERQSQPNSALILALSGVAGLAAAMAIATWRDAADFTFRLPSQIEHNLGVRFLGVLPRVKLGRKDRQGPVRAHWAAREPEDPSNGQTVSGFKARESFAGPLGALRQATSSGPLHDQCAVVGVTSALRGEGRTTVALNLAGASALHGRRAVVVDADMGLARAPSFGPESCLGLADVMRQAATLDDAIYRDEVVDVDVLPASRGEPGGAALGVNEFEWVLDQLRERYDIIVVDLPPLSALSEVAALAPAIGVIVLVTMWGRTQREIVAEALRSAPAVADRIVGAILNCVKLDIVRRMASEPRDVFLLAGMDASQRARPTPGSASFSQTAGK